jgi:predicted nucleotidyltransferase component of viral defense system
MKTITAREHDLILDVRNEGLTALPPGLFEKDLLITEVLRTVAAADSDGLQCVFCGGTCLSKAHSLIERMSEDLDFKLVLPQGLSRSARSRVLSQFKKRLAVVLVDAGFAVPANGIIARDENNDVSLTLHYESRFAPVARLRSEIKVELNARPPVLPTAPLPIASMLDVLIQAPRTDLHVECVSVEETLAEKVLSFLRRTAEVRAGRNRADHDDRLVRHLYDVSAIARGCEGLARSHEHFAAQVAGDAARFRHQYPEFEEDPVGQRRGVLDALHHEADVFERDYLRFVDELVFGEAVTFIGARAVFIAWAERLIATIKVKRPPTQQ